MAKLDSMETLLVDELRDLLDAEKQMVRTLPKIAKAASSAELKAAFQDHLQLTEQHVSRLMEAFETLDVTPRAKKCAGMQGLIEEGQEYVDADGDEQVIDAALIGAAQKVEHYEISAYGTAREHANCLGKSEVADLLQQTLDEEKEADRKLTALAEDLINQQAASDDDDDSDEGEEEEEPEENLAKPASRSTSQRRPNRS